MFNEKRDFQNNNQFPVQLSDLAFVFVKQKNDYFWHFVDEVAFVDVE